MVVQADLETFWVSILKLKKGSLSFQILLKVGQTNSQLQIGIDAANYALFH